jgi:hypothetical protein
MPVADSGAAPVPEPSTLPLADISIELRAGRRRRLAGLIIVLTVAFLPSILSSILRVGGVHFNYPSEFISYRYFDGLLRELTALALLAYVVVQNGQKFSEFGVAF